MKKLTKMMMAIAVIFVAGMTSMSVFAASDSGKDRSELSAGVNQTRQAALEGRRAHLKEQVALGNLSQEDADKMNRWMDDHCYDGDAFEKPGIMDMNRQNNRMMNEENNE